MNPQLKRKTPVFQTIEEADAAFGELAQLVIQRAALKAKYEKSIARLKSAFEADAAALDVPISGYEEALADYVSLNPEKFESPRARKTSFGRYGLRTVSRLAIYDLAALRDFSRTQNQSFIRVKEEVDKSAISKTLKSGVAVMGARLESAETSFYKVEEALLKQAAGE